MSEQEARLAEIRDRVAQWDKAVAGTKGDGWSGLASGRRFIQEDFPFLFDLIASERAHVAALEAERDVLAGQLAVERAYGEGRAVDIRVAALVEAARGVAMASEAEGYCLNCAEDAGVCAAGDSCPVGPLRAALASIESEGEG